MAGFFSILFLWFSLFPGKAAPEALRYFDPGQINLGREYSRTQRLVFIGSFAAQALFLVWLALGGRLVSLSRLAGSLAGGNYWGSVLFFFAALWIVLQLISLPFLFYGNYYWQHHWGFSTQTMGSWWLDYIKGSGLDLALTAAGVLVFFWITRRWPATWWLAGAALFTAWLIIQSFLWPVLISPLFNRFVPARDPAVISMVRELSQKARLPVDQVLVMDASQRTTRANAYFTGLGKTRRIVLYDTLLNNYPLDEVKAVLAHEMAHWSRGHVARGLALGVIGNFILWGLLFVLLRSAVPQPGAFPPYTWALVMLFFLAVSFLSSPLQNYISRGMEREADRVSVMLTGDAGAAERLQVNLAVKNLSDVSPPPFIHWFSYSHPPAPERIELIRKAFTDRIYDRETGDGRRETE
ncbi:MAG: M48 family metallopeptidase [Firmicutes bacterium]|nr:M48 family metallopeptidase [Bacillota bacterium]